MHILDAIGNTSLVQLRRVVPSGCAKIFVKLEWENPTGSMKDRAAQAMIARAEEDGRLKPGGTVVEYTGGSTGVSLALVCVAKGYRLRIVTSNAFSQDKLNQMAAFGAELTLVESEGGLTTKKLILDMIEVAKDLGREPNTYLTDQLNNSDSITGYYPLGEEIWQQTGGTLRAGRSGPLQRGRHFRRGHRRHRGRPGIGRLIGSCAPSRFHNRAARRPPPSRDSYQVDASRPRW